MTLLAVWSPDPQSIWMASDSRLSGSGGPLLEEGVKLFELPVVCWCPGESGEFDRVFYVRRLGLACAGSSLLYHQIRSTTTSLLGNLAGMGDRVPAMIDVVGFTAEIAKRYMRSLGERSPSGDQGFELIIGGWCPAESRFVAYSLRPTLVNQRSEIGYAPIDLATPYYAGAEVERARVMHRELAASSRPGARRDRAPLRVIRAFINDNEAPTIGGDVQVGRTIGQDFLRVRTIRPVPGEEPRAAMWLNGIQTDGLPAIGPCEIGIQGILSF